MFKVSRVTYNLSVFFALQYFVSTMRIQSAKILLMMVARSVVEMFLVLVNGMHVAICNRLTFIPK